MNRFIKGFVGIISSCFLCLTAIISAFISYVLTGDERNRITESCFDICDGLIDWM